MNRFLDDELVRAFGNPGPGAPLTPEELGEHAAHLVWESYSDFMNSEALDSLVKTLRIATVDGVPEERPAKELLIFHLWAHTRAIQLALGERGEDESVLRLALDELHRAVFEDLEAAGYPGAQLPLFEQRIGARYAEYYAAATRGDDVVGKAVLGHLLPLSSDADRREFSLEATLLTHRAIEVSRPFRDYLEQLVLRAPRDSGAMGGSNPPVRP